MRILTAGESHGFANSVIIEGFPAGVKIEDKYINAQLKRRMSGYGRGKRMDLESDTCAVISGLRNKFTLGSPIALLIKNKDHRILPQSDDAQPALNVPRPAHADLAGALKYGTSDVRDILERASARETTARVACGALLRQFLEEFGVGIAGFTVSCGKVASKLAPASIEEILGNTEGSWLNCIDSKAEKAMIKEIDRAQRNGDTLGGVIEVWAQGVCPGLGSHVHYDRRLDARLAMALMSIPAVKGVEIGLGFEYAGQYGSTSHDEIFYSRGKGFYHKTNHSGGIEGGMSNGEPIVARVAMKPIATLKRPLRSVDLVSRKPQAAIVERSDTCALAACSVIAESMLAIVLTESFLEKFGGDCLSDIKASYAAYIKRIK